MAGLWRRLNLKGYRQPRVTPEKRKIHRLEPVRTVRLLHDVPGKWVAIRDGEIVEVRDTFDQVIMALHERDITDATVLRSPDPREPETVGAG